MDLLVAIASDTSSRVDTTDRLMEWYHQATPPRYTTRDWQGAAAGASRRDRGPVVPRGNKKKRREEYAKVQAAWKKNPARAAQAVLRGGNAVMGHNLEELTECWSGVFDQVSEGVSQSGPLATDPGLEFISSEEVLEIRISPSSAPGPDKVYPRQWSEIPASNRALFFNIVLLNGGMPGWLLITRTIFFPKMDHPEDPGDYRPISFASVAVRQLHRILARRLQTAPLMDDR